MDDFWGITILLVIVLTVFIATVLRMLAYYTKYHKVRHEKVRLTDRLADLKCGDIVLFVSHTHGFTNSLITRDLYSHGGVVIREGNELFLSEATIDDYPDPDTGETIHFPEAAHITPLLDRLKHYSGMYFLLRLRDPLTPEQEATLRTRARETAPYPSVSNLIMAALRIPTRSPSRHCMQHVAWLLDEIGLTPTQLSDAGKSLLGTGFFRTSREVTTLPGRPLGGGNEYGPVVELLFDVGLAAKTPAGEIGQTEQE